MMAWQSSARRQRAARLQTDPRGNLAIAQPLTDLQPQQFANLLARNLNVAIVVEPASVPPVALDLDDDHVLACALAAQADLILSGDKDLPVLGTYQNIPIVSAAEALRRVEVQK